MHKEENKVIVHTAKKLGINPTNDIISRCSEFLRLLQLKPSICASTTDASRTVICLDLATQFLGAPDALDATELLKCSGLKKSAYLNTKRLLEKSLDLNHKVGINEICLKLGVSEAKKLANDILNNYKSYCGTDKGSDDFSHPQYAAMAVFCACKKLKVKIQKQKLVSESLLKPQQWTALEKRFEKIEEEENKGNSNNNNKNKIAGNLAQNSVKKGEEEEDKDKNLKKRLLAIDNKEEDYEHWKTRILKKAYRDFELKKLKKQEMKEAKKRQVQ